MKSGGLIEITNRIQTAIYIKEWLRGFFLVAGKLDPNAKHHL
jgi:hypothetical protein